MIPNLREELYKIMNSNLESNPQYLIAKEIFFCLNNGQPLNSATIASKTHTSKPSITRFAQSFGFNGFKEFAKELQLQDKDYFFEDKTKSPNQSYFEYSESIKNLITLFDKDSELIIKVAKTILKSKKIIIVSSPENTFIGSAFAEKLRFLGFQANASVKSQNEYLINNLEKDDLAIFLISGYDNNLTSEIWKLVNSEIKTFIISTNSQIMKFPNPNFEIKLAVGQNVLREQLKPFFIQYILDQIFNIIVYSNKTYMDYYLNPKVKI